MKSDKHLPALDGVRGLAVLIVVAYHTGGGAQSANPFVRAVGLLLRAGWGGVSLFFVLSGFLISGILWDTKETRNWLKDFYIRRVLRIFPLYYGSLLLVIAAAFATHQGRFCLSRIWIFALYLQNMPHLERVASVAASPLVLGHFWSLAVEEQFYLLWPFLIARMKTLRSAKYLCLTTILISFCFRLLAYRHLLPSAEYSGFLLTHAGELAAGGFLAMCFQDGSWKALDRFAPAAAVVSLAGFAGLAWLNGGFIFQGSVIVVYGLAFLTVFWAAVLVLSLRQGGLWNKSMSVGWIRKIGNISYGIYVFHALLAPVYLWIASKLLPQAARIETLGLNAVLNVGISFTLAWLSFRFFESPFLRLRRRFPRKSLQGSLAAAESGQMNPAG